MVANYFATVSAPKVVEQLKEQEELKPLPREVEGLVDDPSVHNPLQRMERLGTGWFGVIMEHDGVLFQDTWELHTQAWLRVAQEMGHPRPLGHLFRRVKGLRDDVVVTTVFNWTQNSSVAKKIAARKAEVYEEMLGGRQPPAMLEARPFLETIRRYNIPVALACSLPDKKVRDGLGKFGLHEYFDTVVTAEDGGATEVEWYFMYAAQQIQRPPMRCIVIGESNTSVEAAHELGMKCVVLSGNNPVYNFSSADLVVRDLSQLTFLNLKKLFGQEGLVEPRLSSDDSNMDAARYNMDDIFAFDDDEFEKDGDSFSTSRRLPLR